MIFILGVLALFDGTFAINYEPPATLEHTQEVATWDDTYTITAYTNGYESTGKRPGDDLYGITTSGNHTKEYYTLACPPGFDFGTKVEIEDLGVRVCEDRGGAIKEKKLDLFIPDLEQALKWGNQDRRVRFID